MSNEKKNIMSIETKKKKRNMLVALKPILATKGLTTHTCLKLIAIIHCNWSWNKRLLFKCPHAFIELKV